MQAAPQTQTQVDSKDRFFRYFRHEVTALQEQMDRLNSLAADGGERNDAVDHCLAGIDRLSHEVKDASSYIPAYDQRTYSEAIKALSEKLQNTRQSFNPPKKFAFKTRKNASAVSISDADEIAASRVVGSDTSNTNSSFAPTPLNRLSPGERKEQEAALSPQNSTPKVSDGIDDANGGVRRPSFSGVTSIHISNHNAVIIIAHASASHATSSGTVTNLMNCTVDLSAPTTASPFSALYLKNILSSTIITGQVSGATHITDITSCKLYVTSRQFRMHGAKNVDVYLHCASRPIIEDCEGVRFAPLPEELVSDELKPAQNQWDQIDDFKWLKAEQSPNWSILPEGERVAPVVEL
ncbi:TBCC-domain-containing protein [Didymella exigua CBS 183.55]|uniref:TBCC-domain-containing protein n=1 Tax=Didymella exigua CBS 183.55 TaxID=1150837 RepID=A0A6A5RUL2_9PLEO|nr:TBCC-domain-containing protein [Didymella exigua CBS 183.55]KAF1929047.1 TBCC-domain-containing protein [Didymella exigua CBS 183.55]